MKMFDINKKFTEYVGMYIEAGYTLSNTMSGHQGEVNKVDLVKGDDLIRVWLNYDRNIDWSRDDNVWQGEKLILRVSRWIYLADKGIFTDNWTTVWNNDLEDIISITYYQVGNKDWFYDNLDDAMHYQRVHSARVHLKYQSKNVAEDITSPATKEIAARFLKRKAGYKRVNLDKITSIEKRHNDRVYYRITYYGKPYHI